MKEEETLGAAEAASAASADSAATRGFTADKAAALHPRIALSRGHLHSPLPPLLPFCTDDHRRKCRLPVLLPFRPINPPPHHFRRSILPQSLPPPPTTCTPLLTLPPISISTIINNNSKCKQTLSTPTPSHPISHTRPFPFKSEIL